MRWRDPATPIGNLQTSPPSASRYDAATAAASASQRRRCVVRTTAGTPRRRRGTLADVKRLMLRPGEHERVTQRTPIDLTVMLSFRSITASRSSRVFCLSFTPAAVCWPSGERLAPPGSGLVLRRHCDSPARTGARTKAVAPRPGRTRSVLGDCTRPAPASQSRIRTPPTSLIRSPDSSRTTPAATDKASVRPTAMRYVNGSVPCPQLGTYGPRKPRLALA
jgi:hypothetical protein